MAKTAAQLVPLKTQLSQNMALFRFADAFTDFQSSVAYQGQLYDNAGVEITANGTTGVPGRMGTPVTATPITTPAGLALTTNQSASLTQGLNPYAVKSLYYIVFMDSSSREGTPMWVQPTIPTGTTSGSITFAFTYPSTAAFVRIYKATPGQGWYRAQFATTGGSAVTSYVDSNSNLGGLNGATNVTISWSTNTGQQPSPDSASQAPPMSSTYLTITPSTSGGSMRSSGYGYTVTAYDALGETLTSAEQQAAVNGNPVITGGVMTAVTATQQTTGGTLPVGKHYYKVTAYTNRQYDYIPGFQNGYTGPTTIGGPETLPSPEINITTTATGQVTLSWSAVTNAQGYVIYRSRDLLPPVQAAATTATTGGTIPASTQYYYVVTATNANGETIASNEVTQTTGAGTATNTISLSWAAVPYAFGYKVYRGTGAGTEDKLLTTIALGSTITYVDTGTAGTTATVPVANTATGVDQETYIGVVNSGASTTFVDGGNIVAGTNGMLQPPKQYNGLVYYVSVAASWTAVSGATGYNLYRNVAGAAGQGNNCAYYSVPGATSYTDTALASTGTQYPPTANFSGSNNLCTVGRYFCGSNTAAYYIDKLGFTFTPVAGKQYRISIYNQSNQQQVYNSSFFTATGNTTYFEVTPNVSISAGQYIYCFVQGADSTSTIAWGPNLKSNVADYPTSVYSENNTWVATTPNYSMGSSTSLSVSTGRGQYPTQVFTESTQGNFPMRVQIRASLSGTSINGTRGTFLGGLRSPQYAYSSNQTYTTPIKSCVPNWQLLTPTNSNNPTQLANRWVTVEVSQDAGSTWTAVQNQVRYVFPSPATQLQWRYTVPEASHKMSFDRRLTTNLPADNTVFPAYNTYYYPDTGWPAYFYDNGSAGNMYMYSNGNVLLGNNNADWRYMNYTFLSIGHDVDITMVGYNNQSGNWGIKFAHDGGPTRGYYFYLDNSGNCGLLHQPDNSISNTTIATVNGVTSNALNVSHVLRVIYVGNHIVCMVDGRVVIDVTDSLRASAGYNCHGMAGSRGVVQSYSITSLTTPANTPQWELEYVNAYLET